MENVKKFDKTWAKVTQVKKGQKVFEFDENGRPVIRKARFGFINGKPAWC